MRAASLNIFIKLTAFIFFFNSLINCVYSQTGTWTGVTTFAPHKSGAGLQLLSDGTILCKSEFGTSDGIGNTWDKLTPDASGSYVNGTWSTISAMAGTRLYFSSHILKDGRIYVAGGEYGTGDSDAEIYDPVTNAWTLISPPGGSIGDANSAMLPDGRILQAQVIGISQTVVIYDPITNSFVAAPSCLNAHDESSWIKQPDNSVLFVDFFSTSSERYIPAINQWTTDANVPVSLYDNVIGEVGPAVLLPDGRTFHIGSSDQTAYYTPSGTFGPGTWLAGPTTPSNSGAPDAPASMMPNGKILCVLSPTPTSAINFATPTTFYEFDYTTGTFIPTTAPGGGPNLGNPCYYYNMINLPDGNTLLSIQGQKKYWIYKPIGNQVAIGTPTVSSILQASCTSFTATGKLFNGISEGSYYGDDWQMSTNFPIIRLTAGTNVYYCRTKNWNSRGLRRFAGPDSTEFSLPPGLPAQTYSLQVIANGIASLPILFTPFPVLTTTSIPAGICTNTTFSFTAVSPVAGATFSWTRPSVAGISNTAITTPQLTDPNEVLINTSGSPIIVNYIYTLTANGCTNTQSISVNVNPLPTISVSGTSTVCANSLAVLSASGAVTYTWSTAATGNTITIFPSVTTTYSVTGSNSYGCNNSQQITVSVTPLPTITVSGTNTICINDSTTLSVSGGTSYVWSISSTSTSVTVKPGTTTVYTVTGTDISGCSNTQSVTVNVDLLPTLTLTPTDTICKGNNITLNVSGASTYVWSNSATTSSVIVSPTVSAFFSVTGADAFGCKSKDSVYIMVDPCTGINEFIASENHLSIYPNPAQNEISVSFVAKQENNYLMYIIDTRGKIVKQEIIRSVSGNNYYKTDLGGMNKGLYFIIIRNGPEIFKGKIILE